jgi:hypothetical protein
MIDDGFYREPSAETIAPFTIFIYLFKNTSQERNKSQNGLRLTIHVINMSVENRTVVKSDSANIRQYEDQTVG